MIKLAVFDLDGTLLNTIDDIADSCNYTLDKHGYPTHSVEHIKSLVGYGVQNLVTKALPEEARLNHDKVDSIFSFYQEYYDKHKQNKTKVYNGIVDMLYELKAKNIKLAVLSNKLDTDTKQITSHYLPNLFEIVYGQREGIPIKPDPQALCEIMNFFGVKPEQTTFIGDSEADVKIALAAKVSPISVTWGFRSKQKLIDAGSLVNVDNCEELLEAITNL